MAEIDQRFSPLVTFNNISQRIPYLDKLLFWFGIIGRYGTLGDSFSHCIQHESMLRKHLSGDTLVFSQNAEQQVFDSDMRMIQPRRFFRSISKDSLAAVR
jgi:hypothetical protein